MKIFNKILKSLYILQEVDNRNRSPKLGKGFSTAYRLNPYNPLSYLVLIACIPISLILIGIIGLISEIKKGNPFKWD